MTSGYDCDFVASLPEEIQSHCSVCLLVLREPHMISCCGHSFCKGCLKGVSRQSKACPLCKGKNYKAIPNKSLERTLNEKTVYCSNKANGCKWTGKLRELQSHLGDTESAHKVEWLDIVKEAQTSEKEKVASRLCQFVEVNCQYRRCPVKKIRKEMEEHVKACPYQPIQCKYCNQTIALKEIDEMHLPTCPKLPISCSNECGSEIVRENLTVHIDKDCPLTKIPCKYSHAGCSFVVLRREIESVATHMKSNMADHLSLMDVAYSALEKKMAQQEKKYTTKIKKASAEIHSLNEKCAQQSAELRRLQSAQSTLSSRRRSQNTQSTADSSDGPGWGGLALAGLAGLAVGAVGAAALMSPDKDEESD